MKQVRNYHYNQCAHGIVTLIINTEKKWLNYHRFNNGWFRIYDGDDVDGIGKDAEDLKIENWIDYLDKGTSYLVSSLQDDDQIMFIWIPKRLFLKDKEYIEKQNK